MRRAGRRWQASGEWPGLTPPSRPDPNHIHQSVFYERRCFRRGDDVPRRRLPLFQGLPLYGTRRQDEAVRHSLPLSLSTVTAPPVKSDVSYFKPFGAPPAS